MANPIAVPGTVVPSGSLATPGGAQGVQGLQGPTAVSTDAGNIATLGSDNLISVPQSSLWSARLRSYNAIGNPTFEVDQKQCGTVVSGTGSIDRWNLQRSGLGSATFTFRQTPSVVLVPGTNFAITNHVFVLTLTATGSAPAASDYLHITQTVEGPQLRELLSDVHSISLLVQCSSAPFHFAVALNDSNYTHSIAYLCTIPTANTWTLITLPNIPVWVSGGSFPTAPGGQGYEIFISVVAGSTIAAPSTGTWLSGNLMGAPGQDNFVTLPVNSKFQLAFVQHEPGAVCSTPIDCPFTTNYDACLRYFCKSWPYTTAIGTTNYSFAIPYITAQPTQAFGSCVWPKRMAKGPTVTYYGPSNGTVNNAFNSTAGGAVTGITATSPSETAANQLAGTSFTIPQVLLVHYTSDTGW